MKRAVMEMDEMAEAQQQQQLEHQQLRQRITQQQQQQGGGDAAMGGNSQFRQQPQQQQQQRGRMTMGVGNDARESQHRPRPPGDTPLSRMADALDESDGRRAPPGGTDELSVIDPRPAQKLARDIVPDRFGVFADLRTPHVVGRDTPFFWHVPRSGGVVVKTMLSHCLGQTLAAEVGESGGHAADTVRLRARIEMLISPDDPPEIFRDVSFFFAGIPSRASHLLS